MTKTNMKTRSIRMNDNPELFNETNNVTRKDAINSLNEFAVKFKSKGNIRAIDIGSADGSVTYIISQYLPKDYEVLIGCDINTNSVEFADRRYGTDRIKFVPLDIGAELPKNMVEDFDRVFSFCTMHWLSDLQKGYRNIYNLLKPGGDCFMTVMANSPMYDIFQALSQTQKWAPWTQDINRFVSPYHDCEDPDDNIFYMLKKIGFYNIETKCKQKVYVYKSTQVLKDTMASINPFKMPADVQDEFMKDLVEVTRDMRLVGEDDSVTFRYNIVLINCIKK